MSTILLIHTDVYHVIWRLLTFPAHSGLTPVHKYIWRLLDFPTHTGFIPAYKDIWWVLNSPAHTCRTSVHKVIWRKPFFQATPHSFTKYKRLLLFNRTHGDCIPSPRNLLIMKKLILISYFTKSPQLLGIVRKQQLLTCTQDSNRSLLNCAPCAPSRLLTYVPYPRLIRALGTCAPTRLHALPIICTRFTYLRAFTLTDKRFMHLFCLVLLCRL